MKSLRTILIAILLITTAARAQNLIKNGAFQDGVDPWIVVDKVPTQAFLDNGSLHLRMTVASDNISHRILLQKNLPLKSNTKYLLRFDAISEAGNGEGLRVAVDREINWKLGHYGLQSNIQIGPEWSTYEALFTTGEIDPADPACIKIHMGKMLGDVYIRNVVLQAAP